MGIRLGFLGSGNMGYAILRGLLSAGALKPEETAVFDPLAAARERAAGGGSVVFQSEEALVEASPVVLLAVKPQYAADVLAKIAPCAPGRHLISIVAGWDVAALRAALGNADVRILRVMPNTPAMVNAGVFGLDAGTDAAPEVREMAEAWFKALGIVEWVPESLFPAVTGLSGSGPAYAAMFIEALADAGVRHGLRYDAAIRMAAQTVLGTAKLILETGSHPAIVKDNVCSPAGTTIEGVLALEESSFRAAVMHAVTASADKAGKLK